MNYEILKNLGQIAGIGGISLGIFFLLFKEIIRKNIFSNLTKEQSYKIIRLIVILVWSIGVLGIIGWISSSRKENEKDSKTIGNQIINYYLNDPFKVNSKISMDVIDSFIHKVIFEDAEFFVRCNNVNNYSLNFKNTSLYAASVANYTISWGDGTRENILDQWDEGFIMKHTFPEGNSIVTIKAKLDNGQIYTKKYNVFLGKNPTIGMTILTKKEVNYFVGDTIEFMISNYELNSPYNLYKFSINDASSSLLFMHPPSKGITHVLTKPGNFTASLTVENPCSYTIVSTNVIIQEKN